MRRLYRQKMIGKQILLWFFVNAILPIVIPALFLAAVAWIADGSFPFIDLLQQLMKEGFYVFSAMTLVFSLYEEYDILKKCVKPLMQIWLVLVVIATLGMFYLMRRDTSAQYIETNQLQFYIIWAMTAISASIIKYKMLILKRNIKYE